MEDPLLALSDEELQQVFEAKPVTNRVREMLERTFAAAGSRSISTLFSLRDEAFGLFWRRRLADKQTVSASDYSELLNREEFPGRKGPLGEAAEEGKLSHSQCRGILVKFDPKEFVWRKAEAFLCFEEIQSLFEEKNAVLCWGEIEAAATRVISCKQVLSFWVVFKYLSRECLETLSAAVSASEGVPRKHRNILAQEVRSFLKRSNRH